MSNVTKSAIDRYYETFPEETRLSSPLGRLELERTKQLIERYLPAPPATVLDVGGANGVYAFWLTELGYTVDVIDISSRLVRLCQERIIARNPAPRSATVGDARSLSAADSSADVVLLMGPLYHLVEREDRLKALQEAHRV